MKFFIFSLFFILYFLFLFRKLVRSTLFYFFHFNEIVKRILEFNARGRIRTCEETNSQDLESCPVDHLGTLAYLKHIYIFFLKHLWNKTETKERDYHSKRLSSDFKLLISDFNPSKVSSTCAASSFPAVST